MRNKRAKVYRKLLASYIRHFGLRPPLQILIDAEMALTLAGMKLSSEEVPIRLAIVLQVIGALPSGHKSGTFSTTKGSLVKLMITQCSITELYKVQKDGERESRAVELAKQWERRYCSHKEVLPGDECICDIVGELHCCCYDIAEKKDLVGIDKDDAAPGDRNKHRYVLAAGSAALRSKIRNEVVGVPIVHANDRNVLVMEPMSDLTRKKCDEVRFILDVERRWKSFSAKPKHFD